MKQLSVDDASFLLDLGKGLRLFDKTRMYDIAEKIQALLAAFERPVFVKSSGLLDEQDEVTAASDKAWTELPFGGKNPPTTYCERFRTFSVGDIGELDNFPFVQAEFKVAMKEDHSRMAMVDTSHQDMLDRQKDNFAQVSSASGLVSLDLAEFREKNAARCADVFHPVGMWSPVEWGVALGGEVGEALNEIKKWHRGDYDGQEHLALFKLAKELADVVSYCDLLAARVGIDLAAAIKLKFNEVSTKRGSKIFL